METSRFLSVGDVVEQLLADRLIDSCHMTNDHVTVVQGTKRHTFPRKQAQTFLVGLLRGRSWNANGQPQPHVETVTPLRAVDKSREPVDSAPHFGRALDDLVAIASEMALITGHERGADGKITIALSSCETEMHAEEAIAFLAECILHKLNSMRRGRDEGDSFRDAQSITLKAPQMEE